MQTIVMRDDKSIQIIEPAPLAARLIGAFPSLIILGWAGHILYQYRLGEKVSEFTYWPEWLARIMHPAWFVILTILLIASTMASLTKGDVKWIFTDGRIEQIQKWVWGERRQACDGNKLDEIRLRTRQLDGPDLFRVELLILGRHKLILPWLKDREERNALAKQISMMFPQTEIDWTEV